MGRRESLRTFIGIILWLVVGALVLLLVLN